MTGLTPFEIWLNEAVTVYIERQRVDALFGADFMRLRTVLSAFAPISGALAEDASPIAMPVEPLGFNRTQVPVMLAVLTDDRRAWCVAFVSLSFQSVGFATRLCGPSLRKIAWRSCKRAT